MTNDARQRAEDVVLDRLLLTMDDCILDPSRNPYVAETFELIRSLRALILRISKKIGVSPIAIAGAIADEYNARMTELDGFRRHLDKFQDDLWGWLPEYVFDWSVRRGSSSKFMNATRHDLGNGNINVATARTVYDEFRGCFLDVPVDTSAFTVVLAALVIKKGMRELAPELTGRSPEIQEAILVTYYKQGTKYVRKFHLRLAEHPGATLVPGEGCRVYHQRDEFLRALGLPIEEANVLPPAPSCW